MPVAMRLMRMGTTHNPVYRISIGDSRKVPTAKFIEHIGTYNPKPDKMVTHHDCEHMRSLFRRASALMFDALYAVALNAGPQAAALERGACQVLDCDGLPAVDDGRSPAVSLPFASGASVVAAPVAASGVVVAEEQPLAAGQQQQMDYRSVFALKHNVLDKSAEQKAAEEDENNHNDVHFILHQ